MKIILSPAKKMKVDTDGWITPTVPFFIEKSKRIVEELRALSYDELKKLWAASDDIVRKSIEMLRVHSFDDEIKNRLSKVVEVEYPITINLLFKRVLNSLGLEKLGSRLDEYFNNIVKETNLFFIFLIVNIVYYTNVGAKCDYFRCSVE